MSTQKSRPLFIIPVGCFNCVTLTFLSCLLCVLTAVAQETIDSSQEIPFTLEQIEEPKLDEPILRKQMFIPDTPVFQLPEIPKIIFPSKFEESEKTLIYFSRGGFDFSKAGFNYLRSSSGHHRSLEGEVYYTSGQDEKKKLYVDERKIRYQEAGNFFRDTVNMNLFASAEENTFYTQKKDKLLLNGEMKYYIADGLTLSDKLKLLRVSVDKVFNFIISNVIQLDYTPDDANNFSFKLDAHRQLPSYQMAKVSPSISIDRLFFDMVLLSGLAKYEFGEFYPGFRITYKVDDNLRAFFSYSSGYEDLFFDELFFRKNFLSVNTTLDYPKEVFSFSEGISWFIQERGFLGLEIFQRKTKKYVYWETETTQEVDLRRISPRVYDEVYLSGVKAKLNYKYKHFEFLSDILYNIHRVPYEVIYSIKNDLLYNFGNISIRLTYEFEPYRYARADRSLKLAGRDMFNITLNKRIKNITVSVEARNIFSKRYEIQSNFAFSKPEYSVTLFFNF